MRNTHAHRATAAGFSLIELLVSMAIALVVSLAITVVMIRTEGSKRSTTSVNDINQSAAYIGYVLDRSIRSAGSGFAQRWRDSFGCAINAAKTSAAILPMPTAFAASSPFANVPQTVRLAPVLIGKGAADTATQVRGDVLTVMGGTGGFGETPLPVQTGSVTSTSLRLPNAVGYRAGDLVLLADPAVPAGCMLQQITAAVVDTLTFGGDYYKTTGTNVNLASFGASTVSIQLGSAPNNPPLLQLYGVGDNNTLFGFDLLRLAGAAAVPLADGVVEMRALYGVDTTIPPDGVLDAWVDPIAGSGYAQAELSDGSTAAQLRLRRIVAIRLGIILRTSLQERTAVVPSGTILTLFGDLGGALPQTRTISGNDTFYRFRATELTIPLRNVMFAPP